MFKHISTARFASRTLELELEANTKTVVPYFASTFIIMGLFSVVTCMMTDWVRSKPWLGLLGNLSAAMATVAAFGLCIYLGIDFIGLNFAAPFLMIGELRNYYDLYKKNNYKLIFQYEIISVDASNNI